MTDDPFAGAEVISAYSREDAIRDGVLVPVADLVPDEPDFAKQAGFLAQVCLTPSVVALVTPTEEEAGYGQDLKGRLWDALNMARFGRPRPIPDEGATWFYRCIFWVAQREEFPGRRGSRTLQLKAIIGPGDEGEPVVTILLPHED